MAPPFEKGGPGGISIRQRRTLTFKSPLPPFAKGGNERIASSSIAHRLDAVAAGFLETV